MVFRVRKLKLSQVLKEIIVIVIINAPSPLGVWDH